MKKAEFKKLVKPLVKECIKEVIFEEGMLSGIIAEVMKGLGVSNLIAEERKEQYIPEEPSLAPQQEENYRQKLVETKKRMLDAIGKGAYDGADLFEGTQPLNSAGKVGESPSPSNPLSGIASNDSGVDISSVFNPNSTKIWKQMKS